MLRQRHAPTPTSATVFFDDGPTAAMMRIYSPPHFAGVTIEERARRFVAVITGAATSHWTGYFKVTPCPDILNMLDGPA